MASLIVREVCSARGRSRSSNAVLAKEPVPEPQLSSLGCNIKWKLGNEPDYFELGHASAHS